MVAVTVMILFNERSIQQIHHHTNRDLNLPESTFVNPNVPGNNLGTLLIPSYFDPLAFFFDCSSSLGFEFLMMNFELRSDP